MRRGLVGSLNRNNPVLREQLNAGLVAYILEKKSTETNMDAELNSLINSASKTMNFNVL